MKENDNRKEDDWPSSTQTQTYNTELHQLMRYVLLGSNNIIIDKRERERETSHNHNNNNCNKFSLKVEEGRKCTGGLLFTQHTFRRLPATTAAPKLQQTLINIVIGRQQQQTECSKCVQERIWRPKRRRRNKTHTHRHYLLIKTNTTSIILLLLPAAKECSDWCD